ncbi:MAG: hypothetical protein ACXWKP_01455 [Bradyrhizobium sp.]
MPLARYFLFIGGVLLALLFVSDAYLPKPPVADKANPDLPFIRIHSDQKWPERVVYNTNLPTIIPAHIVNTDSVSSPATLASASAKAQAREAFAQVQSTDIKPSDPKKPEPTLRKRKIAKRHAPPIVRLAQRPQFVFLGRSVW